MEHPAILVNLILQNFLMSSFVAGYIFRFSFVKKHMLFGLCGGLMVYLVRGVIRLISAPIGINTLLTLVFSIPLYKTIFKIDNWKEPTLISVLTYIMVLFVETLTLGYSLSLFNTSPDAVLSTPSLHFKLSFLQNIWVLLFVVSSIICHKFVQKWKVG